MCPELFWPRDTVEFEDTSERNWYNKKFLEEIIRLLYLPLFEVFEPNLMERHLSELTLTSFSSVILNLTEFTTVNNLVVMVTMKHKQSKPRV
jgi:hypothetical protein